MLWSRLRQSVPVCLQRHPCRTGDYSVPVRSSECVQHAAVRLARIKVRGYHFRSDTVAGESAALPPTGRKNNFLAATVQVSARCKPNGGEGRQGKVKRQGWQTQRVDTLEKN